VTELNYEPRVIEAHARRLNRRADSMGVTSAIIGAVIGGFFGAVPLTSLGEQWPIPSQFGFGSLLAGVLIGALTGYVIGDARSFGYRLQAQSSLCQLNLERNTAALLATSYTEVPRQRSEPPAAPVFEHAEPAPEPAPFAEVHMLEYLEPEPEPELDFEPASSVEARFSAYLHPAPEPAPIAEALLPEYAEPAPAEAAPQPAPEPEPASSVEARFSAYLHPAPEPAPIAEAFLPEYTEPAFEPAPAEAAPQPAPEPAPLAEATPTPALPRLGEAPLPDLDSMSLEQIAELAKTGLI
jgi:hypothetical protein